MADQVKQDIFHDEVSQNSLRPTMTISPEMFEKLYLAPKADTQGNLRKVLGNPTPVAVMGFIVGLTPLSVQLMGWRGTSGNGVATAADSIFFGGVLLIIAGLLEFLLGNTFPFVVFMGYGSHFLTYGTTFIPSLNALAAFNKDGSTTASPPFLEGFGFYAMSMCLLSFVFLLCSIRTNVVFVLVFLAASTGFGLGTGAFWHLGAGNVALGEKLLVGTGAAFFAAAMLGWYLFLAIMLASMDLPSPPVFDLSNVVKGVSQRKALKEEKMGHSG